MQFQVRKGNNKDVTIYRVTGGNEGKTACFAHRSSSGIFKETKVTSLRTKTRQHLIRKGHTAAPGNPPSRIPG